MATTTPDPHSSFSDHSGTARVPTPGLRRTLITAAIGTALSCLAFTIDAPVVRFFSRFNETGDLRKYVGGDVFRELEFLQQFGAITSVILILLAVLLVSPTKRSLMPRIVVALLANAAIITLCKALIGRPRPRYFLGLDPALTTDSPFSFLGPFQTSSGFWSLPSSHTAAAAAFAVCLSYMFPALRVMVLPLAAIVGFARIFLGAHYPSDVLFGATIGLTVSQLVLSWNPHRGSHPSA